MNRLSTEVRRLIEDAPAVTRRAVDRGAGRQRHGRAHPTTRRITSLVDAPALAVAASAAERDERQRRRSASRATRSRPRSPPRSRTCRPCRRPAATSTSRRSQSADDRRHLDRLRDHRRGRPRRQPRLQRRRRDRGQPRSRGTANAYVDVERAHGDRRRAGRRRRSRSRPPTRSTIDATVKALAVGVGRRHRHVAGGRDRLLARAQLHRLEEYGGSDPARGQGVRARTPA